MGAATATMSESSGETNGAARMKRLSAWLIGPLMLTTLAVTAGPAAASTHRATKPEVVYGEYTAYGKYGSADYIPFSLTLYKDHTGTDHFNDDIVWSKSGRSITMVFDGGLWTYLGTKTKTGLSKLKTPGTFSNINGGTGTWYAVTSTG
jgi:hypothetical protein